MNFCLVPHRQIQSHTNSRKLPIDLPRIGDNPIHGLLFGGKAVDPAFVAFVIPDDDVPAGACLVGKGHHHGLLFFGVRHGADYARSGRGRKGKSGLPYRAPAGRYFNYSAKTARNKTHLCRIANMSKYTRDVGNVSWGSGCQLSAVRGLLC
jgi:hypothetical protein